MTKKTIYLPLFNGVVKRKKIKFPSITITFKVKLFNSNPILMLVNSIKLNNQVIKKSSAKLKEDGLDKFFSMVLFCLMSEMMVFTAFKNKNSHCSQMFIIEKI
jgi:hypothetical protein